MAKSISMRGLQLFIADIRACAGKDAEKIRVDKELGKIRKKFSSGATLSDYDRKKYIWKLMYIYMLGYDVEFGHKQACDLIPASKYPEKQVGYLAVSLLLNESDEFLRLVINSVRQDLISRNEAFQCLALTFIANVGSAEMAQLLTHDVMNLLTSGGVRAVVRKKAALALLRLFRKSPADAELLPPDTWPAKMVALLDEKNLGLLLSVVALLLGIVSQNFEGYEGCVPKLISILDRLKSKEISKDYTYYQIPAPWLQVKTMRALQYFPPPEDPALKQNLSATLKHLITGTEVVKNLNKNNAQHAIVFEAIALALAVEADTTVLNQSVALLGKFITVREPNIKYLGLENMCRLAEVPAVADAIGRHHKSIVLSLSDSDISIRRRALDLLFTMCTRNNVEEIVQEMLDYLNVADLSLREELVLKTAVLAERFFPSLQWYVDAMLSLVDKAGDFATKEVWYSVVQLITNHPELHEYGTRKVIETLRGGANSEAFVCCAAYLLGEYGGSLVNEVPPLEQFELLHEHFPAATQEAKALMLSAFFKIDAFQPQSEDLKTQCQLLFERYSHFMDAELQQRAFEYWLLSKRPIVVQRNIIQPIPKWDKRRSLLLRRLEGKEGEGDEVQRPAWLQSDSTEEGVDGQRAGAADVMPPASVATSQPAAPEPDLLGGDLLGSEPVVAASAAPVASPAPAPAPNGGGFTDLLDLLSEPAAPPPTAGPPAPTLAPTNFPLSQLDPTPAAPGSSANPFDMLVPTNPTATSPQPSAANPFDALLPTPAPFGASFAAPAVAPASPLASRSPVHAAPQGLNPFGSPRAPPLMTAPPPTNPFGAMPQLSDPLASLAGPQTPAGLLADFTAPASFPAPAPLPAASDNPFGDVFGNGAGAAATVEVKPTGDVVQWYQRLCVREAGVLYEDQYLQIGCKGSYQGAQGQLVLFFGNKHNQALAQFVCVVAPMPQVMVQQGPAPPQLEANKQVQVAVGIACMAPFVHSPMLQVGYSLGNQVMSQKLALPVVMSKFCRPPDAPVSREVFFPRWKAIAGPPLKLTEAVSRGGALSPAVVDEVLKGMGLGVQPGIDPEAANYVAVGTFTHGGPTPVQVPLMVRVEVEKVQRLNFQVTVASNDANTTAGIQELLCKLLKAL